MPGPRPRPSTGAGGGWTVTALNVLAALNSSWFFLVVLVPYMLAQHTYFEAHPGLLEQLFAGSFGAPSE